MTDPMLGTKLNRKASSPHRIGKSTPNNERKRVTIMPVMALIARFNSYIVVQVTGEVGEINSTAFGVG
ncbi:MAG: hypothetical protein Ct9H90mP27_1210 [Gammaproteobacteria bacterium]|nr:MAG: hypothetical protein Ct9H90mP27_1210 [Gammaproteobacteria bacterium]